LARPGPESRRRIVIGAVARVRTVVIDRAVTVRVVLVVDGIRVAQDVAGHVDDHRTVGVLLGHHAQ
jgi:hypothetical protein